MTLERTYVIPLRRQWLKAPRYRRAKRAINAIKTFLIRHMKSEDVRIGTSVNLEVWKHGMKNPPSRVKVNVTKDDKGVVIAELFGAKAEKERKEARKTTAKPASAPKEVPKPQAPAAEKPAEPKSAEKPAVQAKPATPKPAEKPAEKPTPKLNLKPAK